MFEVEVSRESEAAKRRKNTAHGVSRGYDTEFDPAAEWRKKVLAQDPTSVPELK